MASTIRNGVAVLLPAWVRLGADSGAAGIEMMGQAMIGMLAMLLGFIIMMLVPALATFVVLTWVRPSPEVALMSSVAFGAASVHPSRMAMDGAIRSARRAGR